MRRQRGVQQQPTPYTLRRQWLMMPMAAANASAAPTSCPTKKFWTGASLGHPNLRTLQQPNAAAKLVTMTTCEECNAASLASRAQAIHGACGTDRQCGRAQGAGMGWAGVQTKIVQYTRLSCSSYPQSSTPRHIPHRLTPLKLSSKHSFACYGRVFRSAR